MHSFDSLGPRDPGDAWVIADDGSRYWGTFGAAGLCAIDPDRGLLMQHRAVGSNRGGPGGLRGGARRLGEPAIDAALREASEEAGVPAGALRVRSTQVTDLIVWSYTTVVADVVSAFEPVISDPESLALAWVPLDQVAGRPLHPGFAASWPALVAGVTVRPAVIVDVANVMGSVPDGWWRDRAGAAGRMLERLAALAVAGVSATDLDLAGDHWFPAFTAVLEGASRATDDVDGLEIVRAPGVGDDGIVDATVRQVREGLTTTVVTSDRELARQCSEAGASVRSAGWLLALLDAPAAGV